MEGPTNVIDEGNPAANMYGCLPCPKCGKKYRCPYELLTGQLEIVCDDCGFTEMGVRASGQK